ncbi:MULTISPECIES: potassium-transporting ATPase subunit KdpC [unclassified Microbulbifer]|uniref:potassium-transporting ATPase subunit KdpC n=1 Tax=unclassified Microbulbifer TaxID=2619833 RepID=UPI0027E477E8|nr:MULTISPECIES: potassium-transporting ATPase subunit KdpC [unclassified Microbulbifer]
MRTEELHFQQTGILTGLRFSLAMLGLCGIVYSGATTAVGGLLFPEQARGSLIERDGKPVGSKLVGQPFAGSGYFHGRPSVANYDPAATGGSNLAPDNPGLRERVAADSARIQQLEGVKAEQIPVDLLAASGAGLDPHISPESARLQIARVAAARGLDKQRVAELVGQHIEGPQLGLFGPPRVNILLLNLALDELPPTAVAVN